MIVAPPGGTFKATTEPGDFGSGLVGTIRVRIVSDSGVVFSGPVTSGIIELIAGTGIYSATSLVAPTTAGQWSVYFDDPTSGSQSLEDLVVSYDKLTPGVPPTNAERYVTEPELKASLSMTGLTYADADIAIALDSASRGLEDAYQTLWVAPYTGTRYYTRSSVREVHLGDVQVADTVALDYAYSDLDSIGRVWDWDTGLGTYSTILDPAWYRLLPVEAGPSGNGEPYQTLQLSRASQRFILPSGQDAIKITGTFGWQSVPSGVKAAVTMIATRLIARTREAPFGIVALGAEGAVIRARDIATDPDIRFVMGPLAGTQSLFV